MAANGELGWDEEQPAGLDRDDAIGTATAVPYGWLIGSVLVGTLLVAWFFVAWLALDRHVVDAAGESIGSAFLVLLVASSVGAVRHRHDDPR